jgi:hypothetical protein
MPQYNTESIPQLNTPEIPLLANGEPLPLNFYAFYKKHVYPETRVPIEEQVNGEVVNYNHVNACGIIGEDDEQRMVVLRSNINLDIPDDDNHNIHHVIYVYDPQKGEEQFDVTSFTHTISLPSHHELGQNFMMLETKDKDTSRPKWLRIDNYGSTFWIEKGAHYPLQDIK